MQIWSENLVCALSSSDWAQGFFRVHHKSSGPVIPIPFPLNSPFPSLDFLPCHPSMILNEQLFMFLPLPPVSLTWYTQFVFTMWCPGTFYPSPQFYKFVLLYFAPSVMVFLTCCLLARNDANQG